MASQSILFVPFIDKHDIIYLALLIIDVISKNQF